MFDFRENLKCFRLRPYSILNHKSQKVKQKNWKLLNPIAIFMQISIEKGRKVMYWILRASFVDKCGVKHYAKTYGKRAFRIPVYA